MGSKNKYSAEIKEALRNALDAAHPDGMVGYFTEQAKNNPQSFLPLVGKLLPVDLDHGGGVVVRKVERRIIEPSGRYADPLSLRRREVN